MWGLVCHFLGVIVKPSKYIFSSLAIAAAALAGVSGASAQTTTSSASGNTSWYAPNSAYIGLNAGQSNYRQGCGTGAFSCGDKDDAYSIYGGSMLNNNFGLELGYLNMGDIGRGGGTTKAEGINLSLVGKLPLSQSFGLFGKVGTTYGRTNVSSLPGSGVTAGKEDGFGLSVGAGVSYDFSERWSAVLQWDRHDFKFAGAGRENINATTLGVKYRF
jgi:OOP family OmpA-OmpF porin